jgi:cytochrome c-type biogenesis protein CcmE
MRKVIFGLVIFAMFGMVSYAMMNDDIPVLNYNEAMLHSGKFQIIGLPIANKFSYDEKAQLFTFSLLDNSGVEFNVQYAGVKPGNYDQATEIVVVGHTAKDLKTVIADRILVKCPSKYEADGIEDYETKEY